MLLQQCDIETATRTPATKFRCQNPRCGTEAFLTFVAQHVGEHPRCFCGAEMKKVFAVPQFFVVAKKEQVGVFTR